MQEEVGNMNQKILVVDDEKNIADIIKFNLKKEGYEVLTAYDGEEALDIIFSKDPDLILLDIMMPKIDGFQVCRKVREKKSTPIVMLTARAEEVDKVLVLELGADDYVTKPFSVRGAHGEGKGKFKKSLISRKSKEENSKSIVTYDNLAINLDKYEVTKNGEVIELTLREFELLKFLAISKGQVFSERNPC